jgi:SNF2 family DNA or RNA helicase
MSKPIATLRQTCKFCGKVAQEKSRREAGKRWMIKLECGHTLVIDKLETPAEDAIPEFRSRDGKVAYPYQIRTAEFFEKAGLNGIMAHEMGVGKMVCSCLLIKRNEEEVTPTLFVCKSGLRYQAFMEIVRWTGLIPQIIESARELPQFDYFPIVIISYDTLRLVRPDIDREWEMMDAAGVVGESYRVNGREVKTAKPIRWTDDICAQFKHIVMDECQMIKNPDASRTRAMKKIASAWQRVKGAERPRIMGLSGTPIKNSADEYAPILHMVNPTMFPSENGFIARDCTPIGSGNRYRLRNPEAFHEKTKDFILRYTRAEVLPELPTISRMFRYAEIEEGDVLTKYQDTVKEFMKFMDDKEEVSMRDITNILGMFSRMRRLTGVAKVQATLEFIEEFLLSTDRKIVVFVHHHETASTLFSALEDLMREAAMDAPLLAMPPFDARKRQEIINEFKGVTVQQNEAGEWIEVPTGKNHRVMIASTQAVGEGFNLQFCSDCVIMERQWNPASEEQAEARFPRPGTLLTNLDKINCTYMIAAGTIDDFLTELVERKRSIVASTLDGIEMEWEENSLMLELAQVLQVKGLKKWKM